LAVLLAFLLNPLVRWLQTRGLSRIPAVIVVVVAAFLLLGGVLWGITAQLSELTHKFEGYEKNARAKLDELRASIRSSMLDQLFGGGSRPADAKQEAPKKGFGGSVSVRGEKALPVIIHTEAPDPLLQLTVVIGPALHLLASIGLVVLLVILMLIHREELRNRLIRLAGYGRLTVTTRALDEATQRISYYLMMKSLVNGCFGVAIGVGLWLLDVPYSFLWGFLVAVLRFIPSLGTWLAAVPPLLLAAVSPDNWLAEVSGNSWLPVILVLVLFAVLELFTTNVIEPLTYGHRIGVSSVALVVSLAFWTWLWGPVGLVLATPLTVCLGVLGKYFPQLDFINVLMSDRPAMEAKVRYYQRLLARDHDEATDIVERYREENPPGTVHDELLLPALTAAQLDHERGELSDEDEAFMLRVTRDILEDLEGSESAGEGEGQPDRPLALGYPVRDEAAQVALEMLGQMLQARGCRLEVAPVGVLWSELGERVEQERPALVCVGSLAPGGLALTRSLLKRLRARFPELRVVVARLGPAEEPEKERKLLQDAGADHATLTLLETRDRVAELARLAPPDR
ncbi:MAG: AI-2E family transporter, partial [Gemmataceae bacterium]|nr:AI-2E family transporter [Gemmataceae bacterium]